MTRRTALTRNIVLLGLVSLVTDTSSEMILPLLPLYITALGGTGLVVGLIGGLADSTASLFKMLGGWWADRWGRKKPLVAAGYGLSAVMKVGIALASSWPVLAAVVAAERVGKGVRTAPRDTILARSAGGRTGRAFGLHRAMDTAGAVLGTLLAFALLWGLGLKMTSIFLVAAGVAIFALIPLVPVVDPPDSPVRRPLWRGLKTLPPGLLTFLPLAGLFALANFSYMFFILRAREGVGESLGVSPEAAVLLLYLLFTVVYAAVSWPAGRLADRVGKPPVVAAGYGILGVTALGFATGGPAWVYWLLFAGYGAAQALTEGPQRALVSDLARRGEEGVALGAYHGLTTLLHLPAGFVAGVLWDAVGGFSPFLLSGFLGLAAAGGLVQWKGREGEVPASSR